AAGRGARSRVARLLSSLRGALSADAVVSIRRGPGPRRPNSRTHYRDAAQPGRRNRVHPARVRPVRLGGRRVAGGGRTAPPPACCLAVGGRAVACGVSVVDGRAAPAGDRKSTRLNSSHGSISYAVFCLKK